MKIQKAISARERLDNDIRHQVHQFLVKLDAAGEFAPTVTRKFGGGHDTIEDVTVDGAGNVVLACANSFRGDTQRYTLSYPAHLIDSLDANAIQFFAQQLQQERAAAAAAKAKAEEDARRAAELKTLAELTAKHGPVAQRAGKISPDSA